MITRIQTSAGVTLLQMPDKFTRENLQHITDVLTVQFQAFIDMVETWEKGVQETIICENQL